jgi:4-alpha-glucanotransferase
MSPPLPSAVTHAPTRRAGILVPLFSIASSRSWGIGEIGDIAGLARWLESAGQRLLQLLPINEMPPGETSPYSALSAMAIDPQFISMHLVEDFAAAGGEGGLDPAMRARIETVRTSARIDYAAVRELKQAALARAFAHFRETEWRTRSPRASMFQAFIDDEKWWIDDYALFRSLHARHQERAWTEWPEPVRFRDPLALRQARAELEVDILFRQYVQWVAATQWRAARVAAGPVQLFGDLQFMVGGDSADVWARQDHFDMDASIGVPPDAFSEDGQDWGLPVYRWDVIAAHDFDWLRDRARRNADLYSGYRVDHLVGFYRTCFRPRGGGQPQFTPPDEAAQLALGEAVLGVFREPGSEIIAEDLGIVPDFVRASLTRLGVPGYRVFRWEREWLQPGQPFRDPASYPAASVATSGTHDTEPMATWWDQAPAEEREAVLAIPSLRARRAVAADDTSAILAALFASPSNVVILPVQDAFGWRDRINQPATVNDANWTWKLPWPSDRLDAEPRAREVAAQLRAWSVESGRV